MRELLNLVVIGVLVGTLYGLIAATVSLMFRTTGVLSFAHGGFALIAAYSYAGFTCPSSVGSGGNICGDGALSPYPAALAAVAISTAAALLVERLVIRPLQFASATRRFVATAAVLGLSAGVMLQLNGPQTRAIPEKRLLPQGGYSLFDVIVDRQTVAIFVVSIALVVFLAVVLRRTWFGLGLRAAGQDPATARLMGIRPEAVARFNWALAGAVSGIAGVLVAPLTVINVGTFSFLMVKALGASLIGGLVSLPFAFLGGIAIGVVENVLPRYWNAQGATDVGIAALVITVLALNRRRFASFAAAPEAEVKPRVGRFGRAVAHLVHAVGTVLSWVPRWARVLLAVPVLLIPFRNDYYAAVGVNILYYALATLSVYLVTGLAGQPSLMQAGFVGIGAFSLATGLAHGVPFLLAMGIGVALCAVIGVVAGLVSLRFRRLQFAVVSLVLGAVISEYLLSRPALSSTMTDPSLFGLDMLKSRNVYVVMGALTLLAFVAVGNLKRSVWGVPVAATRELQNRIGHFAINPLRTEVTVFAFSASLAGLAGCIYALVATLFSPFQFIPLVSVTLLLAAVVGGFTSMWGAVIAGIIFGLGPELVSHLSSNSANAYPQIASAGLALLLIVKVPGGVSSLFRWAADVVASQPKEPAASFRGQSLTLLDEPLPQVRATGGNGRRSNGHAVPAPALVGAGPRVPISTGPLTSRGAERNGRDH